MSHAIYYNNYRSDKSPKVRRRTAKCEDLLFGDNEAADEVIN